MRNTIGLFGKQQLVAASWRWVSGGGTPVFDAAQRPDKCCPAAMGSLNRWCSCDSIRPSLRAALKPKEDVMRRFLLCASALVAVLGAAVIAQGKIAGPEDYAQMMKANAQAAGAMNKAIGSGAFADARTQVATLRTNYMALQGFWSEKKKDDAVGIVKDGLTRLDALDKLLGAATVDQMAAQAAGKEFGGATCGACHKLYREGDAQSGFKFKAGVL
jgi:cytochrome c556